MQNTYFMCQGISYYQKHCTVAFLLNTLEPKTKTRTKMIAIRLLKLELNNAQKLKRTEKNVLVHVIFHLIYFRRDRLKRNFGTLGIYNTILC